MKVTVAGYLVDGLKVCNGVDTGLRDGPHVDMRLHFCGQDDCECWQKAKARILEFDKKWQKDV